MRRLNIAVKILFSLQNDIIGSAHVLAQYIKHKLKLQGKVYLVGGKGVQDELDAAGIPYIKSQVKHTSLDQIHLHSHA